MHQRYGIWNITKRKWLKEEDYTTDVVDYDYFALKPVLDRINEIKTLNPKNKDDQYEIREYSVII